MLTQEKMKSERVIVLALIWTKWIPDVFRNTLAIQARPPATRHLSVADVGGRGRSGSDLGMWRQSDENENLRAEAGRANRAKYR